MKKTSLLAVAVLLISCGEPSTTTRSIPSEVTMSKDVLMDKIKGGWAGQTIGCTYGGPTEFKYTGTMINDYLPIEWEDGCIKWWYDNSPGLYDDVYMDLTFVNVFDKLGLDAPVDSFAIAFANAEYELWHGNQAARYNLLHGIMPPASGYWENNPHCDDLDYQIEADYAGIMSPGMPNAASEISDKIGHIISYGDGWYGGVYVGALYSLAFVSDDIEFVVSEALKAIPKQSNFYQCIDDVIKWHKKYPDDWKQTWFEVERKWDMDIGCPHGTFRSYNIDATLNSAYIVIGLLYGQKDFYRTVNISTRCGQDSDCNPASAGGILGTMIGYSKIPPYWMKNLHEVEDMDFAFTKISLNKAYKLSFDQSLKMIERNQGIVSDDSVTIKYQTPRPVRYEKSFPGLYPVKTMKIRKEVNDVGEFVFEGTGAVFKGDIKSADLQYVGEVEMHIDGKWIETVKLPVEFRIRRQELFWKYNLPKGKHTVTFKWLNPKPGVTINFGDVLIYSDAPLQDVHLSPSN